MTTNDNETPCISMAANEPDPLEALDGSGEQGSTVTTVINPTFIHRFSGTNVITDPVKVLQVDAADPEKNKWQQLREWLLDCADLDADYAAFLQDTINNVPTQQPFEGDSDSGQGE